MIIMDQPLPSLEWDSLIWAGLSAWVVQSIQAVRASSTTAYCWAKWLGFERRLVCAAAVSSCHKGGGDKHEVFLTVGQETMPADSCLRPPNGNWLSPPP